MDCVADGTRHGFKPRNSKTDNFKIQGDNVREIDTRFFIDKNRSHSVDGRDTILAGKLVVWTDTNGVENTRYPDPGFQWGVLAHVEVPESDCGLHYLSVSQTGCAVDPVARSPPS